MKIKQTSLILIASLALVPSAFSTVIFTDTFDSGVGNWRTGGTNGTLTNTASELSWTENGATTEEVLGRNFTAQTLATGETIRLSFDYTQTAGSVTILRVGLFDLQNAIVNDGWSNGGTNIGGTIAGYNTFVRDNSTNGNIARSEAETIDTTFSTGPLSGGPALATDNTKSDINQDGTVTYQVVYDVTFTDATTVDTRFTMIDGATTLFDISGQETGTLTSTIFDTAALRSNGGTSLFDNVQVEVIPEPSTALLGALGALMLLRRRRI